MVRASRLDKVSAAILICSILLGGTEWIVYRNNMEARVAQTEIAARKAAAETPVVKQAFDTALDQAHRERQKFWGDSLKREAEQRKRLQEVISTQQKIINQLKKK